MVLNILWLWTSHTSILCCKQTRTPTARPPACLLPSRPVTATSQTMAPTSSPSRGARLPPSSLSWTGPTGRGKTSSNVSHGTHSWCCCFSRITLLCVLQTKGVLWDRLQGPLWRGDYRPSTVQALLQLEKTDAGIHASARTPSGNASPTNPRRHERSLVTVVWNLCRVIIHSTQLDVSPVADFPLPFRSVS